MNRFFNTFLIIIFLLSVIAGCAKQKKCVSPPPTFFFLIKKDAIILPYDVLNNLTISYIESGNKKYLSDVNQATDVYANSGILLSQEIAMLSAKKSIKTYYIEYSNGFKTDTLYVDYVPNECGYTFKQAKFNGITSIVDNSFKYQPVYLFPKN